MNRRQLLTALGGGVTGGVVASTLHERFVDKYDPPNPPIAEEEDIYKKNFTSRENRYSDDDIARGGVSAHLALGNAQSIPARGVRKPENAFMKVGLNATRYDPKGQFDSENHKITIAEDGLYYVSVGAQFEDVPANKRFHVHATVNSERHGYHAISVVQQTSVAEKISLKGSKVLELSEGDEVWELVLNNSDNAVDLAGGYHLTYLNVVPVDDR